MDKHIRDFVAAHNRESWDREASQQGPWSRGVSAEQIARARSGQCQIVLAGTRPVPSSWFPQPLNGCRTLVLAGSGGQQAPILAAAGADVTSFDNSKEQLDQDLLVAQREHLHLTAELGDMQDLSRFSNGQFSLIVHPCSNCFVPDVQRVWQECFRVLQPGGLLLAGFFNPVFYAVDREKDDEGELQFRFAIPYSDLTSLDEVERRRLIEKRAKYEHFEFGHALEDQIGGQLRSGFYLTDQLDSYWSDEATTLNKYLPVYILTRALRP